MVPGQIEVKAVVQGLALDRVNFFKALALVLTVFRWKDGRDYREMNREVGRKIYIDRWTGRAEGERCSLLQLR